MLSIEDELGHSAIEAVRLMTGPGSRKPEPLTLLARRQTVLGKPVVTPPYTVSDLISAAAIIDLSTAIAKAIDTAPPRDLPKEIERAVQSRNTATTFRRVAGIFTSRESQRELIQTYKRVDSSVTTSVKGLARIVAKGTGGSRASKVKQAKFEQARQQLLDLRDPKSLADFTRREWHQPSTADELVAAAKLVFRSDIQHANAHRIRRTSDALSEFASAHPKQHAVVQFKANGDETALQNAIIELADQYAEQQRQLASTDESLSAKAGRASLGPRPSVAKYFDGL